MNEKLFINEQRIELDSETKIAINFQVNDIAELQDRQANYSQSFTVPQSDANRLAFAYSEKAFSSSIIPYRKATAKIIVSGVEVVNEGFAIIEEADDKYRLTVYSGLTDFFSKIDALSLADLDLLTVGIAPSVSFNFGGLSALWNAGATDDLILPLYQSAFIDDNSREIDLTKHFRPSLSFRAIIEAIFKVGDYTYDGEIFSDLRFERLFLPIVADKFKYSKKFIACNGHGKMTLTTECLTRRFAIPANVVPVVNQDFFYQPPIYPQASMPFYQTQTGLPSPAHVSFNLGIEKPPTNCPNNWSMFNFAYLDTYPAINNYWQMQGLSPSFLTQDAATVFKALTAGKYKIKIKGKYFVRTVGNAGSYVIGGVALRFQRKNGTITPLSRVLTPTGETWDNATTYSIADVYVFEGTNLFRKLNSTPSINQLPSTHPLIWQSENRFYANTYEEFNFLFEVETTLYKYEIVRLQDETDLYYGAGVIQVESGFVAGTVFEATLLSDGINYGLDATLSTYDHGEIEIAENLPSMTLKNFLKTFAQMFGLILLPDALSKNIRFIQFKKIVENIAIARDWSSKVATVGANIKFRIGNYGQNNSLQYAVDENVLSGIGDASFSIDDETIQQNVVVISLPFAASETTFSANGLSMSSILFKDFNANVLKPTPRVFYAYKTTPSDSEVFSLVDYNTLTIPTIVHSASATDYFKTYFIDSGEINGLGFGSTLMSENYTELIEALDKTKLITIELNLTASDVANFDFSIPIYLRQLASYFYVNKIQNWIEGKQTKVELLRIN